MNKIKKISITFVLAFFVMTFTGMADVKEVAEVSMGSYGIHFLPKVSYGQIVLTVSKPNGTVFRKTFDSGSTPYFDLSEGGSLSAEGSYTYELRVIPFTGKLRGPGKTFPKAGLTNNGIPSGKAVTQSGAFSVKGGAIVLPGSASEVTGTAFMTQGDPARPLDQVISDDLIVDGSLCVGVDCVNGENFGFDTIRLKENNLRIKFQDTSNSGSFPTNDWQITANESTNGGLNKFSIDDIDGGKTPFTLEAGAPNNSLYVDDSGRVGFGTSTPVVELHVKDGDTPTLRLEQDGSSGYTPQTWDVAGNEANFFIRDVSNGSRLPFRIKPGAPTNSFFIAADGDIGLNTQSPSFPLHMITSSGTAATAVFQDSGGARAQISAGTSYVFIGSKTAHDFRLTVNDSPKMTIDTDGKIGIGVTAIAAANKIEVDNGARLTTGGTWTNSSSREYKENIKDLTLSEAAAALSELKPVKFNYKLEKEEEYVGFIAEDVPELVAVRDRKGLVTMDVVAVLTKVVQEQQSTISGLNKRIAELEKKSGSNK